MYRDDDPFLDDVRRVCLALPETAEVEAWGRPTFRAGKRMFAVFEGNDDDHTKHVGRGATAPVGSVADQAPNGVGRDHATHRVTV